MIFHDMNQSNSKVLTAQTDTKSPWMMTEDQLCDFVNFCASKFKTENRCARAIVETFLFKASLNKFMIKD